MISLPACETQEGQLCQFPFVYNGELQYECVKKPSNSFDAFCATDVNKERRVSKTIYELILFLFKLMFKQKHLPLIN